MIKILALWGLVSVYYIAIAFLLLHVPLRVKIFFEEDTAVVNACAYALLTAWALNIIGG